MNKYMQLSNENQENKFYSINLQALQRLETKKLVWFQVFDIVVMQVPKTRVHKKGQNLTFYEQGELLRVFGGIARVK